MDTNYTIAIAFVILYLFGVALALFPSSAPVMQRILNGRWVHAWNWLPILGVIGIGLAPAEQQSLWVALFFLGVVPSLVCWTTAQPRHSTKTR